MDGKLLFEHTLVKETIMLWGSSVIVSHLYGMQLECRGVLHGNQVWTVKYKIKTIEHQATKTTTKIFRKMSGIKPQIYIYNLPQIIIQYVYEYITSRENLFFETTTY